MAATGNPFDGPKACPFVALELDRDRRAERPDYRHRCFAEATPAPRSIAHQEAYCLSPTFSACPIFQDWALRAAARPLGAPPPTEPISAAAAGLAAAAGAGMGDPDQEAAIDDELAPVAPQLADERFGLDPAPEAQSPFEPAPAPAPVAAADAPPEAPFGYEDAEQDDGPDLAPLAPAAFAAAWDEPEDTQQLGAFDEPIAQPNLPGALTAPEPTPHSSWGQPDAGYQEPPDLGPPPGYVPPPARRDDPAPTPEEAAVPAFLAGRAASQRPADTQLPPAQPTERVSREEIVPSWDIDGRYGAQPVDRDDRGGGRFDKILTAIAVIAILALGVAGVLFLPGLLAGGPGPSRTARPSFAVPSAVTSAQPSLGVTFAPTAAPATAQPTDAEPTAQATPAASPQLYRIRNGDTLARVARRFGITVEQLLAANPDITDPNRIFVGQLIIIPQP